MAIKYNIDKLMKEKGITAYYLTRSKENPYRIGNETYRKLQENEHVNTLTIEKLSKVFDCAMGDIIERVSE